MSDQELLYGGRQMGTDPFIIRFPDVSAADANRYAADLGETLQELERGVVVERQRDRPEAQDFGGALLLVLGTASVTAIANGIAAWLRRHSGARIQIDSDGAVVATNLNSQDAAKIAEAFSRSKQ
jgi:hypothetical protein